MDLLDGGGPRETALITPAGDEDTDLLQVNPTFLDALPAGQRESAVRQELPPAEPPVLTAAGERLPDCLTVWRTWAEAHGRSPRHIAETVAPYKHFAAALGDKPLRQLTKSDVIGYEPRFAHESSHRQLEAWRRIGAVLRGPADGRQDPARPSEP